MPASPNPGVAGLGTRVGGDSGYTLVEMMVTMALIAVLGGMAALVTGTAINLSKSDASIITTIGIIETARDRAVAERRNIELQFIGTDQIRIERRELPGPAKTILADVTLEQRQQVYRFPDAPDTPDQFGGTGAVNFTGTTPVMFTSDGSLIDANGDVSNGTIFIANPAQPETARAITIFGVTGLVRSFRWTPGGWVE